MTNQDWRKSTYSGSEAQCVEVGRDTRAVLVRDTVDRDGAALSVSCEAWQAFTATLR